MRIFAILLLCLVSSATSAGQLPFLDLSQPIHPDNGHLFPLVSSVAALPLTVSIVGFQDRTYSITEAFDYEVELTNPTSTSVTIPWSPDPSWADGAPEGATFLASITLFLGNGLSSELVLGGATIYGEMGTPTSVRSLGPGETVRIRSIGRWAAGTNLKAYLPQTNGRVHIKADLRLQTGTLLASTAKSEARSLTLAFPPQ